MATQSQLAVILHADVVGSTGLVQRDELLAHDRIQETFHRLAATVSAFGGTTREIRGDAVVAEFDRASDAVTAALAFQAEHSEFNSSLTDPLRPEIRIGVALGEVVIADETLTGAGVVLAQRLEQLATPGGVVVQGAVYETVPKRLPLEFANLGDVELAGFDEPVRAYSVTASSGVPLPTPEISAVNRPLRAQPPEDAGLAGVFGPRVAVLPFRNLSPDPDQEFFADGLSEEITLALTASRSFPVIASSAALAFKDRTVAVGAAASELGAQYVLDGSVRRSGAKLRISVELINVDTQLQVWAQRYDRSVDDLFEIQDEITTSVAATVEPEIDAHEMRRILTTHSSSMNSYDLAQRGFWHLAKRTLEDYRAAQPLFEHSLNVDPSFARAFAGLAQGKYQAALHSWEDRQTALEAAIQSGRSAIELDERDPRGLRYFGGANVALGQYDEGLQALRRAITVQPSYATAYSALAFGLALVGEFEASVTAEATTTRLRPGDRSLNVCMMSKAIATYEMGDYETSEMVSRESLSLSDAFWMSSLMLAASLGQKGQAEEARPAIEQLHRLLPALSEKDLSKHLPFRDPLHLDHIVDGLRKAGMAFG